METIERNFISKNGMPIYYQVWKPNTTVKGIVQIAHGIAEHKMRYDHVAKYLVEAGYVVYANDHICHGKTANGKLGKYEGDNFWTDAVDDMYTLSQIAKKEYDGLPLILLGHSMGSLLSREYVVKYKDEVDLLILSGTAGWLKVLGTIGYWISSFVILFIGRGGQSPKLRAFFFDDFNKKFKPNRTSLDWISRDENEVDKFEKDPLRIIDFDMGILIDLINGSKRVNQNHIFSETRDNLPIYIFSGDHDPVGEMGKGVLRVHDNYKKSGSIDIAYKLYPNGRHEMFNEINNSKVLEDLVKWIDSKL